MAQCLGNLWKKLFFNKGLISGLILLGQGDKPFFFRKICSFFCTFFWTNNCIPRFLATSIVNLPNKTWVQNNLENSSHNSEPSHQSGCNINCFKTGGLYKAGLQWGTAPILKSSMLLDPRFQPCLRAVRTGCVRSVFPLRPQDGPATLFKLLSY